MNAAFCFSRQINTVNNITMIRHLLFTKQTFISSVSEDLFGISVFSQLQNTGDVGCC